MAVLYGLCDGNDGNGFSNLTMEHIKMVNKRRIKKLKKILQDGTLNILVGFGLAFSIIMGWNFEDIGFLFFGRVFLMISNFLYGWFLWRNYGAK